MSGVPEREIRRLAVIGLGRVGLPLALTFARSGLDVVGIDADAERVSQLRAGRFPFLEKNGPEALQAALGLGFSTTTELASAAGVDAIVLTIGTPVDEHMNPVFTQIQRVLDGLRGILSRGQLLVLRSTVAPGTTQLVARLIERATGLRVGVDLHVAFCPERIAEGNSFDEIGRIPQIVGGITPACTRRAVTLFRKICGELLETNPVAAELAKLYCNMYRYIDFAIANEFMIIAQHHGSDIHEIVHLVNHGYSRGGLKSPGMTSGPCLYKDGFFLTSHLPFGELISTAWKINETVPAFLLGLVRHERALDGLTAGILGLAFKRDIDDTRDSLAFKLRRLLWMENCRTLLHDPHVPSEDLDQVLAESDVLFLTMNHEAYRADIHGILRRARPDTLVCDIWNLTGTGRLVYRASEIGTS